MNRKIMTQPSLFFSRRYARYLVCASTQAGLTAAFGSLFFVCFGLSFSLQNHINLLFIQHFPCRYAFISKTLRNFAVVNISVI